MSTIKCKGCNERFSMNEWLSNTNCCEPNCQCPKVKEMAVKVRNVIDDAKSGTNVSTTVTRGEIPHGFQENLPEGKKQVYITVADVKVIEVKPNRRRK